MRHKILVLADASSTHTTKWLEGLQQSGRFEIYLISMNPAEIPERVLQIADVRAVYRFAPNRVNEAGGNFQYFFQTPRIWWMKRKLKPDLISTFYLTSYGLMGTLIAGRTPVVHCVVGDDIMLTPNHSRLKQWLTQWALRGSRRVISVSQTMTQRLVERFHYPAREILTQQYGVKDWVLQAPAETKVYDFISNREWVQNSNIDYFLKILPGQSALKTAVVGKLIPGSEVLGQNIMTASQKIEGCELFRSMAFEEMMKLVGQSRYLVSLTTSDGAPLSVMEGMALGAVPILSDTAPNREWVTDGVNGFLLPLADLAAARTRFAAAIAQSEEARLAMVERNRAIIAERGSFTRNMQRAAEFMLETL